MSLISLISIRLMFDVYRRNSLVCCKLAGSGVIQCLIRLGFRSVEAELLTLKEDELQDDIHRHSDRSVEPFVHGCRLK